MFSTGLVSGPLKPDSPRPRAEAPAKRHQPLRSPANGGASSYLPISKPLFPAPINSLGKITELAQHPNYFSRLLKLFFSTAAYALLIVRRI